MGRLTRTSLALLFLFATGPALTNAWAQAKPKGYVITGWNAGADDKKWHDSIAEQAKKNLEAAGYDVTVITQATADQIKTAMKDPSGQALVFIDHGGEKDERIVGRKADGTKDRVYGTDFTTGPYNNYKVVTIHACDQNQQSWKDKYPNADFHSWTGCVYPDAELTWEKNKKYADASNPGGAKQSDVTTHPLLTNDRFFNDNGDRWPIDPLYGGNWAMDPALAAQFGALNYNFQVRNQHTGIDETIFGAAIVNGQMVARTIDEPIPGANFNFIMTYDQYIQATEDPFLLLSSGVLGSTVFVQDIVGTTTDPYTLYAGVRRNMFFVPEPGSGCILITGLAGWFGVVLRRGRKSG